METVRLGKTGLEVSRVGMGGIPLTRPSEEDAIKVVQRALDLGINFFDTAIGYGISEERIGKALAAMAGRRDRVILATKGGTVQHIEWSLQRLRTDYIDLWQFHGINSFERLGEVLQPGGALEEVQQARRASKIRHIGFSSHSLRVALEAVASGRFETVQFPLNFISAEAVEELVPLARAHDVGFIAMKPFAGGRIRDANLALKYLLRFDNVVPDPGIERVEGDCGHRQQRAVGADAARVAGDRGDPRPRGDAILPAVRVLHALPAEGAHSRSDVPADPVGALAARLVSLLGIREERRGERAGLSPVRRVRGEMPLPATHPGNDCREHRILRTCGRRASLTVRPGRTLARKKVR
jgi:diketogulonate reductase-like aldo/keto reductase